MYVHDPWGLSELALAVTVVSHEQTLSFKCLKNFPNDPSNPLIKSFLSLCFSVAPVSRVTKHHFTVRVSKPKAD